MGYDKENKIVTHPLLDSEGEWGRRLSENHNSVNIRRTHHEGSWVSVAAGAVVGRRDEA